MKYMSQDEGMLEFTRNAVDFKISEKEQLFAQMFGTPTFWARILPDCVFFGDMETLQTAR